MTFIKDFLVGGISGAVAKTATAPIERVKLLLQNQDSKNPKYHGMVGCMKTVVEEEGPQSLWRGNTANIVRYFPTQALNFMFKEKYKKMFVTCTQQENFKKFFIGNLMAGGCAGATGLVGVYPLDYARNAMAMDKTGKATMGSVIKEKFADGGLLGLYQGFAPSVAGIFVYRAAYFGLHDVGKSVFPAARKNPAANLALAFTTDSLAGVIAYPFDTVRRRMMMQRKASASAGEPRYNGSIDCAKKIITEEGVASMYKGAFSNIIRGLGGALVLVFYDEVQKQASLAAKTAA